MSVTDTYIANSVIYSMLENGAADANFPTLLTTMFTQQEIVDSMNRVQQAFLLATGMIVTRTVVAASPGQGKYPTPTNSIRPRRLTWQDGAGNIRILTLADTWELDNGEPDWASDTGTPFAWWETTLGQQQVAVAPTPDAPGQINLLYIALSTTLTGLGVPLTVPDDWSPYILWGTLAELLSSDGQSFDPVRANYCKTRYDEGVELANLVLGGA